MCFFVASTCVSFVSGAHSYVCPVTQHLWYLHYNRYSIAVALSRGRRSATKLNYNDESDEDEEQHTEEEQEDEEHETHTTAHEGSHHYVCDYSFRRFLSISFFVVTVAYSSGCMFMSQI